MVTNYLQDKTIQFARAGISYFAMEFIYKNMDDNKKELANIIQDKEHGQDIKTDRLMDV